MDKRGISPIIATLLLISFAVALGVVVMNFGRAQVELEAECAIDIGLKLANIGGKPDICLDAGQLRFTVENGVNIKIEGLLVNVIGTEKVESYELNEASIGKAASYIGKVAFNSATSGKIRQVKLTPKVIMFDAQQICTEKSIILENIENC